MDVILTIPNDLAGQLTRPELDGFLKIHDVFEDETLTDPEQERHDLDPPRPMRSGRQPRLRHGS